MSQIRLAALQSQVDSFPSIYTSLTVDSFAYILCTTQAGQLIPLTAPGQDHVCHFSSPSISRSNTETTPQQKSEWGRLCSMLEVEEDQEFFILPLALYQSGDKVYLVSVLSQNVCHFISTFFISFVSVYLVDIRPLFGVKM